MASVTRKIDLRFDVK